MFWWGLLGTWIYYFWLFRFWSFTTCGNMNSKQVWNWLTHGEDGKGYIYLFLCMNAFIKLHISWLLVPYEKIIVYHLRTDISEALCSGHRVKVSRFTVCVLFWTYKKMHHFLLCISFPASSPLTWNIKEPWNIQKEFSKWKNWIINNLNEKLYLWTSGKSCIY